MQTDHLFTTNACLLYTSGYDFLIEAILKHDYLPRGIHFGPTEIFVNDGAKSDTGNIGDILRHDNSVGVTDPIYPVSYTHLSRKRSGSS